MKQPDPALRVYRMFYPTVVPGDPTDLHDFATTFLVPELESALTRYYGSMGGDRRHRRPGVNYNDPGWRNRLCQSPFQYHRELFRIFDQLHLTARDVNRLCNWWGTMLEVEAWEQRHPGRVVEDDVWEGIPRFQAVSRPVAKFHDAPPIPAKSNRRRSSRIRRFFSRPRAIRSWRDLHLTQPNEGEATASGMEQSLASSDEIEGAGLDDEDDGIENSVGVPLNQQLQAGIRNTEFEDWLKEEAESGNLARSEPNMAHQHPFYVTTNTISYAAPHQTVAGHSYSQRMSTIPYPGDLHTLPVAVSGHSESAVRSSQQIPQTSLARYRTTPYHYRPIRPRPARSSS